MKGSKMNKTEFKVKTVTTVAELDRVYSFAVPVLDEMQDNIHTFDYYRKRVSLSPSLLVYAESQGEVIGCILGSIDEDHVLVGPTTVTAGARRQGIGSAMMQRIEAEARKLNQTTLILGARQEAEEFFLHCGFRPNLFIQLPEMGQVARLKHLNHQYPVIWESEEGKWTRLMLATPQVDRNLQAAYENQLPNCHTQYVFIKEIG
jgi:GNAT superfamily N-acetyltransferase